MSRSLVTRHPPALDMNIIVRSFATANLTY